MINLRTLAAVSISAATLSFGTAARADFIVDDTPVAKSVNFSDTASVSANTTFFGTSGSVTIDFKANVNVSTSNGAASIDGVKSGGDTTPITTLLITPENGTAFNEFSFRGALANNDPQSITVTITDQHDSPFTFTINSNGDFGPYGFEVKQGTGELIKTIQITGTPGFNDFKQFGFGLEPDDVIGQQNGVPEPSTWAMMLLGFAGVGFMAYRRKMKPTSIAA